MFRLLGIQIFQIGLAESLGAMFAYFVVYAQYGFLPLRVIGIRDDWNNPAINCLLDSYGQEWVGIYFIFFILFIEMREVLNSCLLTRTYGIEHNRVTHR